MAAFPKQPGLYWAKRRFVENDNGSTVIPPDEWEIVCVYENSVDGEDRYRVLMIGVEEARPTSCFEWGLGEKSEVKNIVTQPNPHTGGWRLSFQCQSKGEPIELRAFLAEGDKPLSEVWVYRWTP